MSISWSSSSFLASPLHGVGSVVPAGEGKIVGNSAAMRRLRVQVHRIGPHFRTVLVRGEAGTGKELVARTLHKMSHGANGPFVLCHAAEFEDALSKFAGAGESENTIGSLRNIFPQGTLFLNGIDHMSLEMQDRLLQALGQYESAERQLEASQGEPKTDLRIIASTSEDLKILVSTGRFRQEIYQRLAMVEICLPPLRERMDDLPELARHFLDRLAAVYGRRVHEIADDAMERLQRYHWPGNVGELETVLRHAVLDSGGKVVEPYHLPSFPGMTASGCATLQTGESARLQDVVQQHVLRVLKDCRGNKLRAAEMLGISRSTLYRMLESSSKVDASR
jgi:DNA-binding NtrC family response regulator